MTKKIGIITPGGDAPGMNPCVRAVVRAGMQHGYNMVGIKRGYSGLLEEDFIPLNHRSVSGIVHAGGTILKSARCKEIRPESGQKKAAAILKKHGFDWLVAIGGDGSIKAASKISAAGNIPVTGIPASIDNDVFGTDETIGFDTAIDTAIEAIDKIRDTATSFDRVFIIEVMGREHGFLAVSVAIASGAEFVVVPEIKYNISDIEAELLQHKKNGKRSCIIVFAEGAGNSKEFAEGLEKKTGLEARASNLGYIQRGGSPSARSRILAAQFGKKAVDLIARDCANRVVAVVDGAVTHIPISKCTGNEKKMDRKLYDLVRTLAR